MLWLSGLQSIALVCTAGALTPITYDQTYGPSPSNIKDFKPDPTVCTGDAWPQYTCTLKTNVTAPKLYSGNQEGESPSESALLILSGG